MNHFFLDRLRLSRAVIEHMRLNPLRNDLDAYLYHWCEYALEETDEEPKPEDYGLPAIIQEND